MNNNTASAYVNVHYLALHSQSPDQEAFEPFVKINLVGTQATLAVLPPGGRNDVGVLS